jgi:hypothetical protein
MDTVIIKEVIITTLKRKGAGTQDSPIRVISQYWDKEGNLLVEEDPIYNEGKFTRDDMVRFACFISNKPIHEISPGLERFINTGK